MVNFLIQIIAIISINSIEAYESFKVNNESPEFHTSDFLIEYSNEKAFQILNKKCNVCQRKQNKRRIFTEENMHTWANDIYKQVFIKKECPRERK